MFLRDRFLQGLPPIDDALHPEKVYQPSVVLDPGSGPIAAQVARRVLIFPTTLPLYRVIVRSRANLGALEPGVEAFELSAQCLFSDRDRPGARIEVTFSKGFVAYNVDIVLEALRELLKYAMTHEVDEAIRVDGVRAFDPHEAKAQVIMPRLGPYGPDGDRSPSG